MRRFVFVISQETRERGEVKIGTNMKMTIGKWKTFTAKIKQ